MKHYFITIIYCCIFSAVFAQPTGDIQRDTAQANDYLELAIQETDTVNQIFFFNKALKLYENYPFSIKQVEVISNLSITYYKYNYRISLEYARKAIDLSRVHLGDTLQKELIGSYLVLLKTNSLFNISSAIDYGELLLNLVNKPSNDYFEICSILASNYTYVPDIKSLENLIIEEEQYIQTDTAQWNIFLSPLFRAKMQLAYISGNYEKAVTYGKQCLIYNTKNSFYKNKKIGNIQVEVGLNQAYLGDIEKGAESIKEGIEISEKTGAELATYYANLSMVYSMKPNTTHKAIEYAHKSLDLFYQDTIQNISYIEIMNYNLSVFYNNNKDYENALIYIEKALAINSSPEGYQHQTNVLFALGKETQAIETIQKILIALSPNFDSNNIYDNPSKFENFTNPMFVRLSLISKAFFLVNKEDKDIKDVIAGIETANLAKALWTQTIENLNGFEQSQLSRLGNLERILNIILRGQYFLYENNKLTAEAIFKTIEERKAIFLLETIVPNALPDSIAIQKKKFVNTVRQCEQKLHFTEDSVEYYQTKLFEASNNLELFLGEVQKKYPKAAGNFSDFRYTTALEVQRTLDAKSVIIEYVIYDNRLMILLITKEEIILKQVKIDEKTINEDITLMKKLLNNSHLIKFRNRDKFIDVSHRLFKILIEPIAKNLGDKSNLMIIAEKELLKFPFEVLLSSNVKKNFHELDFLIKDFSINYQYSAAIYHQLKEKTAIQDKSFLGFAPIFENGQTIDYATRTADFIVDSLLRSVDDNRFINLPNSKIEIETIAQIIKNNNGKTTVLLEETATKNILREELKSKSYQFIHIATHGIVNFQTPKLSALACYDTTKNVEKALLFANEVQMQDIQADLVVLSSCESGIGKLVEGEGLIALNRSFIASGANNVMFSLWKVNDEFTAELMIDFYKFYFQNQSYTEALRQAKLKMLQDPVRANPRYWAAFVLIGE